MNCCSKRSQTKPLTHHCCFFQKFVAGFKCHLLQRGGVGLNSNAIQWFINSFKTHVICHKRKVSRVYHNPLKHKKDQSSEHSRDKSVGLFKQIRSKPNPLNPPSLENISVNILLALCLWLNCSPQISKRGRPHSNTNQYLSKLKWKEWETAMSKVSLHKISKCLHHPCFHRRGPHTHPCGGTELLPLICCSGPAGPQRQKGSDVLCAWHQAFTENPV